MHDVQIVTALLRRDDELLMVRQAGLGEDPVWTVPGGRVEPPELLPDALVREVREETGITVLDAGNVAFTAQVDERREGYFATVWTWDVAAWEGDVEPADPDELVLEAAWLPLEAAIRHLAQISWQLLTVRYLRGELERRSLWLRRVHEDGREQLAGPF